MKAIFISNGLIVYIENRVYILMIRMQKFVYVAEYKVLIQKSTVIL